jgi:hypothetical protein
MATTPKYTAGFVSRCAEVLEASIYANDFLTEELLDANMLWLC